MGDYTELRVRAIIKPKYRELMAQTKNFSAEVDWVELSDNHPHLEWLQDWAGYSRNNMIPRGGGGYFDDDPRWVRVYDEDTGFWQFQCNLKNYEKTIEYFLGDVLPELAEHVDHVQVQYEEDPVPTIVQVTCFPSH